MFRYTDLKYILLALLSAFAAAGPLLGCLILAILHGDTPPAKEFRFPLTVFGAFAVWVFPFISFLLSSALIAMLLRSSEKVWKKILTPDAFTAPSILVDWAILPNGADGIV